MKIIDISLTISPNLPVWPGDPAIELNQIQFINNGAHANVSRIAMGVHTGTHVDAPHHFLNDGRTIDLLPLDILTGPCYVAQLPNGVDKIDTEVLQRTTFPKDTTRLLFGTRNSRQWELEANKFSEDFVGITADGAQWLVDRGIRLVGIDYLSVAPYGKSVPTHTILLEAGVVIVEGLNLAATPRGLYDLYCLPLKLLRAEGAPARAILVQE